MFQINYINQIPTNALIYYCNTTLLTLYVTMTCFNPQKVILREYD